MKRAAELRYACRLAVSVEGTWSARATSRGEFCNWSTYKIVGPFLP